MIFLHLLAQSSLQPDPSGLPVWLTGGSIITILSGLLFYFIRKCDALEKEFRTFIIHATEQQWESVGTIGQALKVFEKVADRREMDRRE